MRIKKSVVVALLGNMLDHYDTALYGLLAPFIAPLIFPESSAVASIIKTYGLMSTSIITRPLGALVFGTLGARYGAKMALFFSLTGLACVTFFMGLLPTHENIGELAPFMLALLRMLQGFFAAGETTIAPFFVLQQVSKKRRGLINSIYSSTTIMGELFASLAAVLVSLSPDAHIFWRLPFIISALTACAGIYVRLEYNRNTEFINYSCFSNIIKNLAENKGNFLRIIFVSGMSYITYSVPFIFFNNFIPQITSISYTQMLALNTSLLAFDMFAAPLFGWLADRVNHAYFMSFMSFLLAIFSLPLFFMLENSSNLYVSIVRIFFVLIGLGFCAPLHAWFMTQFDGPNLFVLTGLAYSIGSELFGRSAPAICLLLYNITNSTLAPAIYISFVAMLATISLVTQAKHKKLILTPKQA